MSVNQVDPAVRFRQKWHAPVTLSDSEAVFFNKNI